MSPIPPRIRFPFSQPKANAVLTYLLWKLGGRWNYMALLKLAFFADRYHVRKYARPVSFDEYFAMKLGPVPSNLLNTITLQDFLGKEFSIVEGHDVRLNDPTKANFEELSESDVEALDFALAHFAGVGEKNEFDLADLTHAYPEWDQYKERFKVNPNGREEIDYADFLLNANPDHIVFKQLAFSDPFPPLSKREREDVLEEMREYASQLA
ncbi:MAG: DUF4065 domain-containing protein [Ignavibacteria bacterium]|nr:DUF4065 domain-containing protein [Ignavibacteria bacterium]